MIKEVLQEREKTHGDYESVAEAAQDIKGTIRAGNSSPDLSQPQLEALDMIASKIARISNGNPNDKDHWLDIAGYAQLIVNLIEKETKEQVSHGKRGRP